MWDKSHPKSDEVIGDNLMEIRANFEALEIKK